MVEDFFTTFDNLKIFYRQNTFDKSIASLVLIHGLGEHSGRYSNFFNKFSNKFNILAMDLRGHGRSGGKRGHILSFSEYLNDIKYFIEYVRNISKNKKIYLLGHSMGGLISVRYAECYPGDIKGMIVSSPLLKMRVHVHVIKKIIGRAVSRYIPGLSMQNGLDPAFLSHDKSVVEAYKNDPLVHTLVSARWFTEVTMAMEQCFKDASKISMPCLLLHAGDDQLTDPEGSRDLFPLISSKNKELKVYEGLYHEIFNEIEKERVFADLEKWLMREVFNVQ